MGTRVLLADDSITIQKLVEMAFSDTDFELLSVSDGKQAIEKLNDFRPDIVLADAIMPVKDGYQVCEHIKSDPQFANVPVVLLTGRFQPYDEGRAQAVGIDERIVKPFVQDQLVSLVRQLVPEGPQDTLDLEPIEEAEETLESELTDEEASYTPPNINADSHTTIRVKPDDLKAFLKEVEQPADEVEELDQLDEVEELDLADEDDLEEVFEDSFSKSLESLDLDDEPSLGGETQAINQTEIQSRLQQEADSIDATVAMDETEAMDFLDEAEAAEVQEEVLPPAEFDESPVMSVEDDEDLEKTVKISEFESFQAISEQHHLMEERHDHEEPQDSDVMDLDPNQMRTLSLDDEEQEPQAESTFSEDHTFEHDSFEIKEPESLDLSPPEPSENPEDLLELEPESAVEEIEEPPPLPTDEEPTDLSADLELPESVSFDHSADDEPFEWPNPAVPEVEEIPEPSLSENEQEDDPEHIATENLDETLYPELEEPLGEPQMLEEEDNRIDTGPIDFEESEPNLEEPALMTEESIPDLEPDLQPLDDLDSPMDLLEETEVVAVEESTQDFSVQEIDEPLLGDLDEESLHTEEQEIPPEPELDELLDLSDKDEESPLSELEPEPQEEPEMEPEPVLLVPEPVEEETEDTASNISFPDTDQLHLGEPGEKGQAIQLDKDQLDYLVEAVAKRVVALLSDTAVKEIAWEVIPELSEAIIKKRIYELEKTVDAE